jgi:hypothetical protein
LLTPPFTQLNTPYPATAYLKGFLNTKGIVSFQADLGIEVILKIFSRNGLQQLFSQTKNVATFSENARRIYTLQCRYIETIDAVIAFLQNKKPTLAPAIAQRNFLPEASRFANSATTEWAFGALGTHDKAKYFATMYLEDLADYIKETTDEYFGFSRYAEKLGRSASSFDALYDQLNDAPSYTDTILFELLEKRMMALQPALVAISVPFPGNLYAAFQCAQWIKKHYPEIKIAMGGGFANTELRSLSDPRVFNFFDFITLDDGEAPLEHLLQYLEGVKNSNELKRTFLRKDGMVAYANTSSCADYRQSDASTPDYSDLLLDKYISVIEVVNPMHRLWSDGRWNKLTMAHGCYWGKCTFCDISLDYISRYEPLTAAMLCDRMETLIAQTGENGFHFVDEAAPPALMRALALEIIKRRLTVSWWTNIRFEKSFTKDLCLLLRASGCIAVSGGLEVASDRLLQLIQKGITVEQVALVTKHFTEARIMVHAYLMYGFPTQTPQETIDSLEMVRQLFKSGVLQSAFWHLFTMTAHSPVGLNPGAFGVQKAISVTGSFANNDIPHIDPVERDPERFGKGLKKALFNYMHGIGLEEPLGKWFEFKVPKTSIAANYMLNILNADAMPSSQPTTKIIWLGQVGKKETITQSKKGNTREMLKVDFVAPTISAQVLLPKEQGEWLIALLPRLSVQNSGTFTRQQIMENYKAAGLEDFELFWDNKPINTLSKVGLLQL